MKGSSFFTAVLIAVLLILHVTALRIADSEKKTIPATSGVVFALPSAFYIITTHEFKGLASDFLFLKALVFYGSTYERNERPRIKEREWVWFHQILDVATDVDPYFFDPYFLANAAMTWEGGMIRETNKLLEKGSYNRQWDWMLPFFIGFNNFYFLHDNDTAAKYLMKSSLRPGASPQIASLATRLSYKEHQTENAIQFLETILSKTDDEELRKNYMKRIRALQARLYLERAVTAYKRKYGHFPFNLELMVKEGFLEGIPRDPFDGTFSVDEFGKVHSTSDDQLLPQQR